MAQRFLALDWDQQLHVVQITISGNTVRFQRAILLDENSTPNLGMAESLGTLLRQRLKDAGMSPAPVLASIGRDRLILKDIRYPVVPEHEEPAVVRFQAVKELHDTTADDVVIDYLPTSDSNGERQAQVYIARREMVEAYHHLCKAAGLKLAGLAPRPLGMAACLQRTIGATPSVPPPEPRDAAIALVTVGEKWAEFCILREGRVLQTRTLTLGPTLAGEIRRNLAVHAGQGAHDPVKAVYLALSGQQAALRERLVEWLDIPVYPFDPFAGADSPDLPSQGRGTFAGAVGLAFLWAARRELPVNFASAKQAHAAKDPNQRAILMAVALVLILFLCGIVVGNVMLDQAEKEKGDLEERVAETAMLVNQARDGTKVEEALHEWGGGFSWTDHYATIVQKLPKVTDRFKVQALSGELIKPTTKAGVQAQNNGNPKTLKHLTDGPTGRLKFTFDAPNGEPLREFDQALQAIKGATAESGRKGDVVYDPKPHTQTKAMVFEKAIEIWRRPVADFKATPVTTPEKPGKPATPPAKPATPPKPPEKPAMPIDPDDNPDDNP